MSRLPEWWQGRRSDVAGAALPHPRLWRPLDDDEPRVVHAYHPPWWGPAPRSSPVGGSRGLAPAERPVRVVRERGILVAVSYGRRVGPWRPE